MVKSIGSSKGFTEDPREGPRCRDKQKGTGSGVNRINEVEQY